MLCLAVRQEGKKQHSDAFGLRYGIGSVAMLGFAYTNVFLLKALDQTWFYHSPRNVMATSSSDSSFQVKLQNEGPEKLKRRCGLIPSL